MVGSKANTLRMQKIRAAKKDTKRARNEARKEARARAKQGEASVAFLFIFAHYFPPFNLFSQLRKPRRPL